MHCPRPHCGGLLLEIDGGWMKCVACARPIRRSEAEAQQKEATTMGKPADKCPAKYCRNEAATCAKHAGGGAYETLCGAWAETARATAESRCGC